MNKYCKALELDKVLLRLSKHCCCADSRAMALAVEPAVHIRCKCADQPVLDPINRFDRKLFGCTQACLDRRAAFPARTSGCGTRASCD